jgi:hypothetical protein
MTLKELKEIIELFTAREALEELEVEKAGVRLKIKRAGAHVQQPAFATYAAPASMPQPVTVSPTPAPVSAEAEDLLLRRLPIPTYLWETPFRRALSFASSKL